MENNAAPTIPAEEVAELLKKAIKGEIPVALADPRMTWDWVYAGNVEVKIGDWRVTFFNDCGELDYVDSVEAPDGRKCDDWAGWKLGGRQIFCPLNLLEHQEYVALEDLLSSAK